MVSRNQNFRVDKVYKTILDTKLADQKMLFDGIF